MKRFSIHLRVYFSVCLISLVTMRCGSEQRSDASAMTQVLALVSQTDSFLDNDVHEDLSDSSATNGLSTLSEKANTFFHSEIFPPHWLQWTTDGSAALQLDTNMLTHGIRCDGRYCDNVNLLATESGFTQTSSWWTDSFSEEGNSERVCANNGFVTGIQCSGSYCDNVSLKCSQINNGGVRSGCYWSSSVSEESGGKFIAPESMYVAGVRCSGRYCDNKELYLCKANNGGPSFDLNTLAIQFAPRLRFDQEFGTGSGDSSKCFPSDPAVYFQQRANGSSAQSLCNKNYSTISNNQIPTYFVASQVGTNSILIRYWYFYAWQSTCFVSEGDHAADWESMAVLIVDGQLTRAAFFQHGGWYVKEKGSYEVVNGSHPVVYVGKNAHGSYHDAGGSGGCLYFEDFRNPGGNDYRMDTWNNMNQLYRGSTAPAWMNCTGSGCFDGIGHPIEQTGNLESMGGCGKDGCSKSSISNLPFIGDPTSPDFVPILAKHSGKALEIPSGSGSNSINVQQYENLGLTHQRWGLESTGDGYFRISALHSGKCLDIQGASTSDGANVLQYSCGSGSNQRFQLLSQGDGSFALRAKHSSRCFDVAGGSLDNGANILQWSCHFGDNQRFRFAN